jgi:hypothetical protein
MNKLHTLFIFFGLSLLFSLDLFSQKIFDVHIHGKKDIANQIRLLDSAGVYKAAISTSWDLQNSYVGKSKIKLLNGLMLPCPNGKVPYSQQSCFTNGKDFPDTSWVEQKIRENKIDFIGEVLSQYYGISPSDTLLFPYYTLAERYHLPVGIHTGLAGPNHGSPNFKVSLGNPILLEPLLIKFPKLKVWIMHAGGPYLQETIAILSMYRNVYADISAICNPYIVPPAQFYSTIKTLIDAGLEDRIMFGSDNGNISDAITSVNSLSFLSSEQKEKIFYKNAEHFFSTSH